MGKIYLRNAAQYSELAEFDPATCEYAVVKREKHKKTTGHYCMLSDQFLALYSTAKELYLCLNTQVYHLEGGESAAYAKSGETASLDVKNKSGHKVLSIAYPSPPLFPPLHEDPTGNIEEEDFDFGLYVANMINDPERLELLREKSLK